jgi:hypothetical protein
LANSGRIAIIYGPSNIYIFQSILSHIWHTSSEFISNIPTDNFIQENCLILPSMNPHI